MVKFDPNPLPNDKILQSKLDTLYKLKKDADPMTIAKAVNLFEISLSFVSSLAAIHFI